MLDTEGDVWSVGDGSYGATCNRSAVVEEEEAAREPATSLSRRELPQTNPDPDPEPDPMRGLALTVTLTRRRA